MLAQVKSWRGWRLARGRAGVIFTICSCNFRAHCWQACARFLLEGTLARSWVEGYVMGRFWLVIFDDNLGLFDQRIFSPVSVGSIAPTASMARPNPF